MELFDKTYSDWETLEQEIDEAINLIENLREKNKLLTEKNSELKEEKKTFNEIKKKMEMKIKELLEKLSTLKE
ncbi:hypothetical protein KAU34_02810 [candidate division WOR-3 bacterium]|nr:hypothetical protein [candidate division WOR-3 bacterium]